jgi:hypothetical protein
MARVFIGQLDKVVFPFYLNQISAVIIGVVFLFTNATICCLDNS